MSEKYDSAPDTLKHIELVRRFMRVFTGDWVDRMQNHDRTKLEEPERSGFDTYTPKLREMEYGSGEYKRSVDEMAPFIQHHYERNDHHPEHWEHPVGGLSGMPLPALLEMVCDWKAAGMRHANNPGIEHSIEINQARFGYSDEVKHILLATARMLAT